MIYLDTAAATPLDPHVLAAMNVYFSDQFYNPSATYLPAQAVKAAVDTARSQVGYQLGARGSEIVFTAGGTEANNLAIQGIMAQFPDATIAISPIEHDSVRRAAERFKYSLLPLLPDGRVDINTLEAGIDDTVVMVSCMYVNNEIGTIEPIREIAAKLEKIRKSRRHRGLDRPLFFHTDAAQAANYLDLHTARLGVDLMSLNGGKIYGPKQSGCLYVKNGISLVPALFGGGQEFGLRPGTENVAADVGFSVALERAQSIRKEESKRLQELQTYFFDTITTKLPNAIIGGSRKYRIPNNFHIALPGLDNETMLIHLEQQGILAAAGSACSAKDTEPSHVLQAIGYSDSVARASIRATMGRMTTRADIDSLVHALIQETKA